ncbi:MAG: hypothetical protein QXS96_07045 [Candidatus Caldarchaeum sp.]
MRYYLKPPRVYSITARYGSCLLCSKPLVGKQAIYLSDMGAVVCDSHSFYLVLQEFDNGYMREFTVVDTAYTQDEAEKKASELNKSHMINRGQSLSFNSYTYMHISEALQMRPRTGLVEE